MTDRRLREARAQANVVAPPVAILTAALVLGATLGFALALMIEVARPRVSDLQEAERVTGARVPGSASTARHSARARAAESGPSASAADRSDIRRLSHSRIAHERRRGSNRAIVTITGDVPSVTATIAANIAAVSANEMRSTLLVDADLAKSPVTSVLRLPAAEGVSAVLTRHAELPAVAVQAPVGRDRWLEVVPTGVAQRGPIADSRSRDRARSDRRGRRGTTS